MKIRIALPLLLAVSTPAMASAPPPAPPAAPQPFGEVVEVNVVNVEVYVTDKAGNRVTGLRKGDFELLEDGKPVEISNFEAVSGAASQRVPASQEPASQGSGGSPSSASVPGASPAPGTAALEDAWNLVVYFDNENIRPGSRARAIQQLREFLTRQLTPGDRVMLVTNDLGFHIRLPFSTDPAAISKALDGLGKLATQGESVTSERRLAFEAMITIQADSLAHPTEPVPCPQNITAPAHAFASSRRQGVLQTLGSLTLLVNSLSGVPGRKAVLHVSDGIPLIPGEELFQYLVEICGGSRASSGLGKTLVVGRNNHEDGRPNATGETPSDVAQMMFDSTTFGPQSYQAASQAPMDAQSYNVAKNLETLAAHANAHRVTLHTLQPGLHAPEASAADIGPTDRLFQFPSIGNALRANNRDSLQLLADETGGRSILDANDFLPDLTRVREDALSFYSLGFTPAHNGDGREHQIAVKVKRPGLQLRYRQSYRDKTPLEKIVDRTLSALLYNVEDNPLDISVEIGEQTPGTSGLVAVPVRLRIPLFKLAILNRDDTFQGSLKLFVVTRGPNGGTSSLRQVAVPLSIPRKDVLRAMGQFYLYNLTLQLQPGEQQVALAVRDDIASTTSFLSRAINVSPTNTAAVKP